VSPRARLRVVVDGSNLATEGRTDPSLSQLDQAVRAFLEENPGADVIVVADATFAHRVTPSERARFNESELAGEIVTPPAGAIGRGDAFILKIADRIKGVVLSNDSFQEFQGDYPWLFDEGRLIGGKPVSGVGWVFTPRLPVRGAKSPRAVKKLSVALPGGAKPAIGATLTPVKRVAKATPAAKAPAKAAKKAAPAKATAPAKAPAKAAKKAAAAPGAPAALRRDRQPVNPEAQFTEFRSSHRVGSRVEGEVTAFTSHGAVITVATRTGRVECYAPTAMLGDPAPARARDVLKRGDRRTFKLVTVDAERRIAELALT
jgi:Zc3h12a-like Ribonuclease NYN domain